MLWSLDALCHIRDRCLAPQMRNQEIRIKIRARLRARREPLDESATTVFTTVTWMFLATRWRCILSLKILDIMALDRQRQLYLDFNMANPLALPFKKQSTVPCETSYSLIHLVFATMEMILSRWRRCPRSGCGHFQAPIYRHQAALPNWRNDAFPFYSSLSWIREPLPATNRSRVCWWWLADGLIQVLCLNGTKWNWANGQMTWTTNWGDSVQCNLRKSPCDSSTVVTRTLRTWWRRFDQN